jgi:hypothetical protein
VVDAHQADARAGNTEPDTRAIEKYAYDARAIEKDVLEAEARASSAEHDVRAIEEGANGLGDWRRECSARRDAAARVVRLLPRGAGRNSRTV